MPRPRSKKPSARAAQTWDSRGDLIWKWLLRLSALVAFFYVLVAKGGDVPMGVYVIIGGFAGLPNILSLQRAINERGTGTGEDT